MGRTNKRMNRAIRAGAGRNRLVVETDAERPASKGKGKAPKDPAAGEELPTLEEVNAMTAEELEAAIPAAEEALEASETELEELRTRRDGALAVIAAMNARVAALEESGEEGSA